VTLKTRLARLESGPRGIKRFIVAILGESDEPSALFADRGIVESAGDMVILIRKPGQCSVSITVDGVAA